MSESKSIEQNKVIINSLEAKGFPINLVRFWNDLQRRYSSEGLTVLEYEPSQEEGYHWRCHIGKPVDKKISLKLWSKKGDDVLDEYNHDLEKCFNEPNVKTNQTYWNRMAKNLNWKGFFMPTEELNRLEKNAFKEHLNILKLRRDTFPFVAFFRTLKAAKDDAANYKTAFPILAIWHYFRYQVDFLKEVAEKEPEQFASFKNVFKEHFALAGFEQQLPSEQLVELLFLSLERFYIKDTGQAKLKKLINRAFPSVQSFFEKHGDLLKDFIKTGFKATITTYTSDSEKAMQKDFVAICSEDKTLLIVQELLDDQSGKNMMKFLDIGIKKKFGALRDKSIKDRLKSVIGDASILDRIQSVADKVQASPEPLFAPAKYPMYPPKSQKWTELSSVEHKELLQAIEELPDMIQAELVVVAKTRWNRHFQNLLNPLTAPFLVWEQKSHELVPQVNGLESDKAKVLQEVFWKKREEELEELAEVERKLLELYKLNSKSLLEKYLVDFKGFSYSIAQEKWDQALGRHRNAIEHQTAYRRRRMRELGILKENERMDYRKEIFLDEMLQIEEEVKPFILFVKKAFQTALPIRRSTEFHPFRHSHDGVEFDPETVQDTDKWVRANVMKTLRNKVDRGEVTQINTFCLDSSGSMEHERMRNLFKILYLLILGLEDRKSFDAVHFFNTFFVETVNFTDDYTNRSLLFKVLRQISTINSDEKVYYGGGGGTNISDGIQKCHERMMTFKQEILAENPDANVVCSLFVITDGEPSLGIIDSEELHEFIEQKRAEGDVAIKGIYIKSEDDDLQFMEPIFGADNFVENVKFNEAVNNFVSIMTQTYKAQRKAFKWKKKLEKNNNPKMIPPSIKKLD